MTVTPPERSGAYISCNNNNQRMLFIDILRGFTMLFVVYAHVDVQLLWSENYSAINNILSLFRMPLFFFISGFFMYSDAYTNTIIKKRTLNRLLSQLYPTIILFILFVIIFMKETPLYYIFTMNKAGYWFTFVSVEYFFFMTPLFWLFTRFEISNRWRTMIMTGLGIVSLLAYSKLRGIDGPSFDNISKFVSIIQFVKYIPFLLAGCIVKVHWKDIERYCLNRVAFLCITVVFIGAIIFRNSITNVLIAFCGIGMTIIISYNLPKAIMYSKICNLLSFIGTKTLEIYLIHYFIIALMQHIDAIPAHCIPFCNSVLEFPVYMSLSLIIVGMSLLSVYILKFLMVYGLVFPKSR